MEDDFVCNFGVFDDEPPVNDAKNPNIANWNELVRIVRALPVKTTNLDYEGMDRIHPTLVLDRILGPVGEDFIEDIGSVKAETYRLDSSSQWDEVILYAVQVASTSPVKFFNALETPTTNPSAPCSRFHATELEYLFESDMRLEREFDVVSVLFSKLKYIERQRTEWSAAFIKLVHLCQAIFKKSMIKIIGTEKVIEERIVQFYEELDVCKTPRAKLSDYTEGKGINVAQFMYEIFVCMAYPHLRISTSVMMLNLICGAEYHSVRCAIDACSPTVLHICLMSPRYLVAIWLPYMRLYYPTIFKHDDKDEHTVAYRAQAHHPTWNHLVFYTPSKSMNSYQDPTDFIPFLQAFFAEELTADFRASFSKIETPNDYKLLHTAPGEIFTPKCRPRRRLSLSTDSLLFSKVKQTKTSTVKGRSKRQHSSSTDSRTTKSARHV